MLQNVSITKIKKRDGRVLDFNQDKITEAIFKAARSVGGSDRKLAEKLSNRVAEVLDKRFKESIPSVEQIQDIVEEVLIKEGHAKTAKTYILYRQKREELRKEKMLVLEKDSLDEVDKRFDLNALRVLKARYLRRDGHGHLLETPTQLFTRVGTHVALPDVLFDQKLFDKDKKQKMHPTEAFDPIKAEGKFSIGRYTLNQYHLEALKMMYDRFNKWQQMRFSWSEVLKLLEQGSLDKYEKNVEDFYNVMIERKFMPNTPAIANFGNVLGMGSACFVMDVPDSIEGIMETLKQTSIIFKAGGGMGYNFSKLRPEGDFVSSTGGIASGPLSFMRLFDTMTEVIKQGGIRRGANMGILNSNHPDIERFITAKEGNKSLRNFNISVLIMPDFWEHYDQNKPYPLINPRTGEVVKTVNPRELFDRIVFQAWESAEPGVIFFDPVNRYNPFYEHLGPIVTTNPCVAADSLISTDKGLERIDAIQGEHILVDNRVVALDHGNLMSLQYGCQIVKPIQRIKTGYKECYKLETKSGFEVTATPEHKILTPEGWKELRELKEGDGILIQSGQGKWNEDGRLPFEIKNEVIGENGRKYTFHLPTIWSRELGMLLGWMVGDGWLSTKYNQVGLVFAKEDEEARKYIQPIFEQYCNRRIKMIPYENGCVQVRSASRHMVEFFTKLGVQPVGKEREVPQALFTAPEEAVVGFLEGLLSSDGTIGMGTESRNYIRLNSSSLKLLKHVQLLLLNMGIRSAIYDRSTKAKNFRYVNKKGEIVKYTTSGRNYDLNMSKQNLFKLIQRVSFIQRRNKSKIETLGMFEFYREQFLEKVKSIEYVGEREVWDITEPITHSFIANGVVVHNCGEVLLYPYESCNLGSINVWAFARENDDGSIFYDWEGLKQTTLLCTKFLDNVIEVNKFPLQQFEEMALATRKIGLGVMGLGDLLFELRIPYNSEEGRAFMEKLMQFINYYSKVGAIQLSKERGPVPYFDKSFYPKGMLPFAGSADKKAWTFDWSKIAEDIKKYGVRNGYTTVIAPTGSISMIAGCSSGMEPVYSLCFEKNVKVGSFYYVDPVLEKVLQKEGLYSEELMEKIAENRGSMQDIEELPEHIRKAFVVALDITPEEHIRALAAFQKWTDSSISKTNNFPPDATVEDMRKSYILAYKLGCKDVTVFRDTSIKDQVLVAGKAKKSLKKEPEQPKILATTQGAETNHAGKKPTICPECSKTLDMKEGCVSCPGCGWGVCS
ncbi:intein-containing adenosylcobalamin-dependent ribonucleoside-diphosphate reductase [Candidatus Woesearchaeota archaeon]|nr:intein-containing adenosylcobalamin-dependent ribonucleoside-diphosphate reductase [Candidatus Woesearchaeota archaeon]